MGEQDQALCCVATQDYLPGLIALYRSVLEHQDLPLFLMAVDCDPEDTAALKQKICDHLPARAHPNLRIVSPVEIYGANTRQMRYYYDAFEFSTACKSAILAWMERNTLFDRWLYLDGDMLCFGSLAPLFALLDAQSILLTPHRTRPGSVLTEDLQMLCAGAYNAGVLGIRRSSTSHAFATWYLAVLSWYCLNDPPLPWANRVSQSTVIFADQRWLDLVPAYFPEVVVARDRCDRTSAHPTGTAPIRMARRFREPIAVAICSTCWAGVDPSTTRSHCKRHSTRPSRRPAPRSPTVGPDRTQVTDRRADGSTQKNGRALPPCRRPLLLALGMSRASARR